MKLSKDNVKFIFGLALLALAAPSFAGVPSQLTYQGRLQESGALVNGNRDINIGLCANTANGGCPDNTNCLYSGNQTVSVTNGIFRTTFTVPSGVDLTSPVYLEVREGAAGGGANTCLAPREQLTISPYAIVAATANYLSPGLYGPGINLAGSVGIGTQSPATLLDVNGAAQFGAGATKSTFTAAGALIFDPGYVPVTPKHAATKGYVDAQVGGASPLLGSTNTWSAQQTYLNQLTVSTNLLVMGGGSLGIATNNPTSALDVFGTTITIRNAGGVTEALAFDAFDGSGGFIRRNANTGHLEITPQSGHGTMITQGPVNLQGTGAPPNQWALQPAAWINDQFAIARYEANGAVASKSLVITSAGNLGFGNSNPVYKLDLTGVLRSTDSAYLATAQGNVGIGTVNPATLLDVNGGAQFGAGGSKSTFTATGNLVMVPGGVINLSAGKVTGLLPPIVSTDAANKGYVDAQVGPGGIYATTAAWSAQQNFLNQITVSSNVGLGTNNPVGYGTYGAILQISAISPGAPELILDATPILQHKMAMVYDAVGLYFRDMTVGQTQLMLTQGGNLGVGVQNPVSKLHMSTGVFTMDGNVVGMSVGISTFVITGGNVGIGTINPAGPLEVVGNQGVVIQASGPSYPVIRIKDTSQGVDLKNWDIAEVSSNQTLLIHPATDAGGSATSQPLTLTRGGNVGINSLAPPYRLDVMGIIRSTDSAFLATGQGAVGIGTINPATLLDVNGGAQFGAGATKSTFTATGSLNMPPGANITLTGAGAGSLIVQPGGFVNIGNNPSPVYMLEDASDARIQGQLIMGGTVTVQGNAFSIAGSTLVVKNGSVGIGTVNPSQPLHVVGNSLLAGRLITGGAAQASTNLTVGCGGLAAISGSDSAGKITMGTGGGTCGLNFNAAWAVSPLCFSNLESTLNSVSVSQVSTSSVTFARNAGSFGPSDVVDYYCVGR